MLATGGTIAMQQSAEAGGNVPALSGQGLVDLVGGFVSGADLRVEDWERLPGVHRGPLELWAMRDRVAALTGGPNPPDGVVITHGTDTLEETAYLLARTVPPAVPVVVTGSMRTSSDAGWDGPRNLRDAVRVAAHPKARNRGTLVVFAGKVFDGRDVAKLHTFSTDPFRAPHRPPVGEIAHDELRFHGPAETGRRGLVPARSLAPRVAIVPLILGDDGSLLADALPHFDGVVIEGFGRGNVPPGALPAIRSWLAAGKPVVLASRCPLGEVGGEYAFDGGGGQLFRMGVRPAGPRPTSLARLELSLCLSAGVPYGGETE